jgi:hypothetical protein
LATEGRVKKGEEKAQKQREKKFHLRVNKNGTLPTDLSATPLSSTNTISTTTSLSHNSIESEYFQ